MPGRRRLSHLLLASHAGLVLLLALLLIATGAGTIRTAVVGQARAEAERAVSEARRRLQEWRRELSVGAGILAEQPTLRFYLERGQITKARALIEDFHATSDIEYILVRIDDRTIAEVGPSPPSFVTGFTFDSEQKPWRVVRSDVDGLPGASVVVAEQLGRRLLARPASDSVSVALEPLPTGASTSGDPWLEALRQVSASGDSETFEDIAGNAAARLVVLRDEDGRPSAILSARVAQEWVERGSLEWLAAFSFTTFATCALALVVAAALAARIARPFVQLAHDAERLGGGDLVTPVIAPRTSLAEPLAMAASLEEMRKQVGLLTAKERNQRLELDAVLDGVDEGIVGIDADNRIHYANRQFLALIGCAREEVLGLPRDAVLQPDSSSQAFSASTAVPVLERCTAVGKLRPLTVRRQVASRDTQVLIVREENAVEAARAMRDRILANLSHEFQTPLTAQIASNELLRDHLRSSADKVAIRLADSQYRGILRLTQLVENLLDSVRIESGEMRLRRQPVDLVAAITDAIELMRPLVDQRDQRVVASLPQGSALSGDGPRLFSVFVNLLANANKFAPDQTTIWVDVEWAPDRATVWVEDEGPGLPPSGSVRDLFAPFKRAPKEEPSQRGSGLGLAIVYAVVAAHGGEVVIAAPVQRSGARLGVVLPLEAPA